MRSPLRQHGYSLGHGSACILLVIQILATLGCQSMPREPLAIPTDHAQRPEERNSMPVGRVVSVDAYRIEDVTPVETPTAKDILGGALYYVIPPMVLLAAPAVLVTCLADGCEEPPADKAEALEVEPEGQAQAGDSRPQRDAVTAAGVDEAPTVPLDEGEVFRHRVQLVGSEIQMVRYEFWRFEVGDCVALRAKPYMLVPALAGACD